MKKTISFPKVMVALDLSLMDEKIIPYSRFIAQTTSTKKIQFIHVIPQFIVPEPGGITLDELIEGSEPVELIIRQKIIADIQSVFSKDEKIEIEVDILRGQPQDVLLDEAKQHRPDLLIIGKKAISGRSGIIARRIARKTDCAVYFVSDQTTTQIHKILVPLDFSKTSAKAMQAAIQLSQQLKDVDIVAFHVISVPKTAYNINKNFNLYSDKLKENANAAFKRFVKENALDHFDIELKLVFNDFFDAAMHIAEYTQKNPVDLIIIGAKGHSLFEDVIFGSVTENLVNYESQVPILVIR